MTDEANQKHNHPRFINLLESADRQVTHSYPVLLRESDTCTVFCTAYDEGSAGMISTNYTDLRENLKKYMDQVCDNYEPLVITRRGDRSVVMLSEESYNNILENMYIMGDRDYYQSLLRAKEEIEAGRSQLHELIEADDE